MRRYRPLLQSKRRDHSRPSDKVGNYCEPHPSAPTRAGGAHSARVNQSPRSGHERKLEQTLRLDQIVPPKQDKSGVGTGTFAYHEG